MSRAKVWYTLSVQRIGVIVVCASSLLAGGALASVSTQPVDSAKQAAEVEHTQQATKVYSLKHADGEHVVSVLRSLFIVVNPQIAYAQFQYDRRTDSLFVAASQRHHKQIAEIVALLDTPADAPKETADEDYPKDDVARIYSIRHAAGEDVVSVLRSLFTVVNHRVAYARLGFDKRTKSLIVIASDKHHKQIAEVVVLLDTPPDAPEQGAGENDSEQVIRVYSIKHAPGRHIISKLRSTFVVVNQRRARARFGFDKRTNSLIVVASHKLQEQIAQLIVRLDTPPELRDSR